MPLEFDAKQLTKSVTIKVRIKRHRQWKLRLTIAVWLIRLARWISWVPVDIEYISGREPWLYYCPSCGRDVAGHKPERTLEMVLSCPHCCYQFLVGGCPCEPYAINPKSLQDDVVLCKHGCHFEEPYGFVVMGGCPIHD